jgi:Tol biopolymer transport system component
LATGSSHDNDTNSSQTTHHVGTHCRYRGATEEIDMRTLTAVVVALVLLAAGAVTQERRPQDRALQAAIRTETVDGNLESAIKQFADIAEKYKSDRAIVATALVHMAGCYKKRGDTQARAIFERILREFSDQKDAVAVARAQLGGADAPSSGALTYRRVWADSGRTAVDLGGSVSPDGKYLTYIDWNAGDLMLRHLGAGTDRRLTGNGTWPPSGEFAEQSVISRDGHRVAYGWFNGKSRYELRVGDLRTAQAFQPRTALDQADVVWIAPHDWSPDGKWIAAAITRPDRSVELWLVDVNNGAHRKLRSLDWAGSTKSRFSPDGKLLAFDVAVGQAGDNERDAFVLTLDGSRETPVARNPGMDRIMGWSPDGTRLLFSSDRSGSTGLWAQRFTNGLPSDAPELLKADIGHTALGTTTTGALYVGHQVGGRDVYIGEVDFGTGTLVKPPERAADRFVGNNEWPDWSRDGKYLSHVYAHNWMGRDAFISIRSLDTAQTREIPLKLANGRFPLWSPDGRSFVSQGTDMDGRSGIFRINAVDGSISPIVVSSSDEYLSYSEYGPDGRKLYYTRFSNGSVPDKQVTLVEHDIDSGKRRVLARMEGLGSPFVSPDGRSVATIQRTGGTSVALVVPVAGGEPREVMRVNRPQVFTGGASWSPDGKRLMINTFWDVGDRRETWLVPVDGGPHQTLDLPGYSWGRIRVHPDGRRIAYHAGQLKFEVWALENFLPAPTSSQR